MYKKFFYEKLSNEKEFLDQQILNFNNLGWNYHKSLDILNKILLDNNLEKFDDSKISMISQHIVAFCGINNKPKRILEIGTYDGLSALLLSKIFPNAEVITLDLKDDSNTFNNTYNINVIGKRHFRFRVGASLSNNSNKIICLNIDKKNSIYE